MAQPTYSLDRRREPRPASNQRVTVTNLTGARFSFHGQLTDTSTHGLGLKLLLPVEERAMIAVEWADTIVLGEVVHCRESRSHYLAGLKTDYMILDRTLPDQAGKWTNSDAAQARVARVGSALKRAMHQGRRRRTAVTERSRIPRRRTAAG